MEFSFTLSDFFGKVENFYLLLKCFKGFSGQRNFPNLLACTDKVPSSSLLETSDTFLENCARSNILDNTTVFGLVKILGYFINTNIFE